MGGGSWDSLEGTTYKTSDDAILPTARFGVSKRSFSLRFHGSNPNSHHHRMGGLEIQSCLGLVGGVGMGQVRKWCQNYNKPPGLVGLVLFFVVVLVLDEVQTA